MQELKNTTALELQIKKQQELNLHFIGRHRFSIDGGKVFEMNKETNEITLALYEYPKTYDLGGTKMRPKLIVKPNCIYVESLNKKSAYKRILNGKYFHQS